MKYFISFNIQVQDSNSQGFGNGVVDLENPISGFEDIKLITDWAGSHVPPNAKVTILNIVPLA